MTRVEKAVHKAVREALANGAELADLLTSEGFGGIAMDLAERGMTPDAETLAQHIRSFRE